MDSWLTNEAFAGLVEDFSSITSISGRGTPQHVHSAFFGLLTTLPRRASSTVSIRAPNGKHWAPSGRYNIDICILRSTHRSTVSAHASSCRSEKAREISIGFRPSLHKQLMS